MFIHIHGLAFCPSLQPISVLLHFTAAVLVPLQESEAGGDDQPLRLRGGGTMRRGRPASKPQEGAAAEPGAQAEASGDGDVRFAAGTKVEVMNDEDGLRGCW